MDAPDRSRPVPRCTAAHSSRPPAPRLGAAAGLEGILAARRAPAFAPGHEGPPAAVGGLHPRRRRGGETPGREYQQADEGRGHLRDHQRQRPAGPHHGGDPVRLRPRHHHDAAQLAASVRRRPRRRHATSRDWKAPTRAATTRTRRPPRRWASAGWGLPYFTGAPLIAYRKSWFAEVGASPAAQDARGVPEARHRAQEEGQADRPDARPHLRRRAGLDLSVHWTFGGAETDPSGKKVVLNSKGTLEAVNVDDRLLEAGVRRECAGVGRHQQQPRLPRGRDQRHAQRRLDLHLRQAQSRQDQERQGRADVAGHRALGDPRRPRRAHAAVRGGLLPRAS